MANSRPSNLRKQNQAGYPIRRRRPLTGLCRTAWRKQMTVLSAKQTFGQNECATAPLQLGPIVITAREIVGGEMREDPDGQSLVELSLEPSVAAALKAFTKASVGGPLDIRVDRNLVRTVNIVEGVEGDRFILPLTKADAQSLSQSLGLDGL